MLLPYGKLIGLLLFCLILLVLLSILFIKPNVRTYRKVQGMLARPVMGTIFLVSIMLCITVQFIVINVDCFKDGH